MFVNIRADGEATNDITGLRFVVTVKHYSRSIIACNSVVLMALHICINHVKHAGGTMCGRATSAWLLLEGLEFCGCLHDSDPLSGLQKKPNLSPE